MKNFKSKSNKELEKVLIWVLVVCLVIWIVVYIQVNMREEQKPFVQIPVDPTALTPEQRTHALTELKAVASKSPPVTDTQRAKALAELKRIANQKK